MTAGLQYAFHVQTVMATAREVRTARVHRIPIRTRMGATDIAPYVTAQQTGGTVNTRAPVGVRAVKLPQIAA